jgi:hypothetical protein
MPKKKNALGTLHLSPRQFPIVEFKDYYGEKCSLEMSSIITPINDNERLVHPGTSAVWLGRDDRNDSKDGEVPHMHLNRKQVAALVHVLQQWLRTGRFE